MTYIEFIGSVSYPELLAHIESLDEYKVLRSRIHPYKIMEITVPVIFRVDVTLTWGENEATVKDIERDCVIWDDERIVFSDLLVKEKVAEQKNAVKAYLKDLKALVKREAKKLGFCLDKDTFEDAIHDLA